jgi:dienelactone hydrolase
MELANVMATSLMCVAVLAGGCVDESDDPEAEHNEALIEDQDADEFTVQGLAPGEPKPGPANGAVVVGVETLDVTIPAALHAQGLDLPAKLVRPKWSKAPGEQPAMLVLHGSGGLLKDPSSKQQGGPVCSSEMEAQYRTWADRLANLGYTVLLPSSYSARGFCDKHTDAGRMPKTFDDKPEQILSRTYDFDAAARYLCDRPEVDCDRMGLLGFSQGGTMVMVALHWQIEQALAHFRKTKGKSVDIDIPDLKPGRPEFQVGIAYYPGCGFDGVVPTSTGKSGAIEHKFSPTAPLSILHGSKDALVKHCSSEHGPGSRQIQSKQVADELGLPDLYDLTVYEGAGHSFDSAKNGLVVPQQGTLRSNPDAAAREAALEVTLTKLAEHL